MTLRALHRLDQMRDNWERNHPEPFRLTSQPQSTLRLDPAAVRDSIRGVVVVGGTIVKVIAR